MGALDKGWLKQRMVAFTLKLEARELQIKRGVAQVTTLGPILIGLVSIAMYHRAIHSVGYAVTIGFLAVMAAVVLNLSLIRSKNFSLWFNVCEMQPVFDKTNWFLMAMVLLISAVDAMNLAAHSRGIPEITDIKYNSLILHGFTRLEIFSLIFGILMICAPILSPRLAGERKNQSVRDKLALRKLAVGHVCFWFGLGLIFATLIIANATASPDHLEGARGFVDRYLTWRFWEEDYLNESGRAITLFGISYGLGDIPVVSNFTFLSTTVGLLLFFWGYFRSHQGIFQLYECFRVRSGQVRFSSEDQLIWLRTLRTLTFEAAVVPPIIAGASLVSGSLDDAAVVVYGLFIYSGFSVWNLSVKVVRERRDSRSIGAIAVLFQFICAGLLTVLWSLFFWKIEQFVTRNLFIAILRLCIGTVLVQIVFGPIYRNAWGQSLSDKWLFDGPEYVVVTTIVCFALGAMHDYEWYKWLTVLTVLILLILVPAKLLRRSMTAYVLIRVKPGETENVRKVLLGEDMDTAVVYGDFDLVAKAEVPGDSWILKRRVEADSRNLKELAVLVKRTMRRNDGRVLETQTLLDFTHSVHLPREMFTEQIKPKDHEHGIANAKGTVKQDVPDRIENVDSKE